MMVMTRVAVMPIEAAEAVDVAPPEASVSAVRVGRVRNQRQTSDDEDEDTRDPHRGYPFATEDKRGLESRQVSVRHDMLAQVSGACHPSLNVEIPARYRMAFSDTSGLWSKPCHHASRG
jgi:hypothetical protein